MSLVDDMKLALGGIKHSKLDSDISDTIDAACRELVNAGVDIAESVRETDPLVKQAIKLYVRAYFNYQGEGERWSKSYENLRDSLALCGDYREVRL